jgi:hypothetical protein
LPGNLDKGKNGMEPEPQGRERRLSLRLLAYWRDLAGDQAFPRLDDVDGGAIPDMWPNCFILNCRAVSEPVFAEIGSAFAEWSAAELGGKPVSTALRNNLLSVATQFYGQVIRKRVPITLGGEFVDSQGRSIQYRSILCPLSDDRETIDHLLGGANFRVLPAA